MEQSHHDIFVTVKCTLGGRRREEREGCGSRKGVRRGGGSLKTMKIEEKILKSLEELHYQTQFFMGKVYFRRTKLQF